MARVYNFSAGPSMLPEWVLRRAQEELLDYHGSGQSVMEMSHRSKWFEQILQNAEAAMRRVLGVPDNYKIGFFQGGATQQFAMVPLNLMTTGQADYIVTGNFSNLAAKEAAKFGQVNVVASSKDKNFTYIPDVNVIDYTPGASYIHICQNNTIFGTAWDYIPETGGVPLVCDMSSEIMSHPVDVARYRLIYAGAQKNMAPAGLTVVIVEKAAAGFERADTPQIMSYKKMIDKGSMLNTPPCWCIYMLGLVLEWVEAEGGVAAMDACRRERSRLVYEVLDNSRLYKAHAEPGSRSCMNVTFRTGSEELDAEFVKGAAARGLLNDKGHRLTGGMRASLYNAMPIEGAAALAQYMKDFEVAHHV